MKVLILGADGKLGPWVVRALEGHCDLRLTDVSAIDTPHDSMVVDVADLDQVMRATEGMDAIVNCSVLRSHRKIAFDVNTLGTWNAVRAAVEHGMSRFVNTGPHFTVTGPVYYDFDYGISAEVPAHSGTGLYALTKACGQEICRIFSENHPIHILCLLFLNFKPPEPEPGAEGRDLTNFSVTFRDAGEAVRLALEVDLETLPSRNEVFFITADLPHGKYSNAKARRLLGFEPQDKLEKYWRRKREC